MITTINEWRKINEYHVDIPKKMELTYVRTDSNGNFIYKDINGKMYQDVEGVIHDVTNEGEPLSPVHNVVIKKGEPIYNPEDRFGRNPGSKVAESTVNEASGDYSTETHAIADTISKNIEQLVKDETSGQFINKSEHIDLLNGVVKFEISDPTNPGQFHDGQIVVEIFDNLNTSEKYSKTGNNEEPINPLDFGDEALYHQINWGGIETKYNEWLKNSLNTPEGGYDNAFKFIKSEVEKYKMLD